MPQIRTRIRYLIQTDACLTLILQRQLISLASFNTTQHDLFRNR